MIIMEYADAINQQLEIRYYPNQGVRFSAQFARCEIKGDGVLIGAYGDGCTPQNALDDYVKQIAGKTIIFNASTPNRREFMVPTTLTIGGGI